MAGGPFATDKPHESLLLLQSFLSVCGVMTLALAAEVRHRRRAEREARSLAVSDPVTGLGNYRRLVDSLEWEIKRAERTGRPFAFVLFDLDDLKQINDIHGHLVGTRAICRCANILRLHSRSIDTVARYGGDEFAMILPETDRTGGTQVAARMAALLVADGEQPAVAVSFGVAIWANDWSNHRGTLSRGRQCFVSDEARSRRRARRSLIPALGQRPGHLLAVTSISAVR